MTKLEDIIGDDSFGDPDDEPQFVRIPYLIPGTVLDRQDPLGAGRVRLFVESLFEQGTPWLSPLQLGGGSARRGNFDPPLTNARAVAWFPLGKKGPGYYLSSAWLNKLEVPLDAEVELETTRSVAEDGQWLITRDDRAGRGEYQIKHKKEGTYIQLNEDGSIVLEAKAGKLNAAASEAIVLGDSLKLYLDLLTLKLNTHTHDTIGAPGVPFTATPTNVPGGPGSTLFSGPGAGILSSIWDVE